MVHPGYAAQPTSGLQLKTGFFFMQWFLFFKRPRLEINGRDCPIGWGMNFVPLPPGHYDMRIYVPGLLFPHFNTRSPLTIYANHVTGCSWDTAFFIFMEGKLRMLGYKPWGS